MSAQEIDFPPDLRALETDYELIRELGRGGMAAVYLARERETGRLVAIKAVRASYVDDEEALHRFEREARTVADLDHPNIVRTYDIKRLGDRAVGIVMQHVTGGTVRDRLRERGAFAAEYAEGVLRDIANALRYAHQRGIVHRDVKPENIFLDEGSGRALLSDFGIARPIDGESGLTMLGAALGTPQYMSPEQVDGRPVDGRSDIYSLGVLGWELLTGRRPWAGESLYSVIYKQKHEDLPRVTAFRPRIPANLLFAIEGALVKDRDRRWQSADEFLSQLTYSPPPVLSQRFGEDRVPASDEPTVQFRRATAELATVQADPSPEPATASFDAADEPYSPPTDQPPFALDDDEASRLVPPVRARAVRALGLFVPLAIAAVSLFIVFDGGRVSREARGARPDTLTSTGNVALPDPVAGDSAREPAKVPVGPPVGGAQPRTTADARPAGAGRAAQGTPPPPRPRAGTGGTATRPVPRPSSPSPPLRRDSVVTAVRTDTASVRPAAAIDSVSSTPPTTPPAAPTTGGTASTGSSGVASSTSAAAGSVPISRCHLPANADQRACLLAYIDRNDAKLNDIYQALIGELKRAAGVSAGDPEPPSVRRLRSEQRAWLGVRDTECRRQAAASDGPFWAQERAPCFAQMSGARSNELQEAVERLRRRR